MAIRTTSTTRTMTAITIVLSERPWAFLAPVLCMGGMLRGLIFKCCYLVSQTCRVSSTWWPGPSLDGRGKVI